MKLELTLGLKSAISNGGGKIPNEVPVYFMANTWTGTGVARDIVNGLDLAAGSMVLIRGFSTGTPMLVYDTDRGAGSAWQTNQTASVATVTGGLTSFNDDGFSIGTHANTNSNGVTYLSWSFKTAPGFLDIILYNGSGAQRQINHNLGVEPGMIIVKRRDNSGSGAVYHRLSGANPGSQYFLTTTNSLPTVNDVTYGGVPANTTTFTVGTSSTVNDAAGTYVAYVFAHNPDLMQAGKYTGNGNAAGPSINLGWRPRALIIRRLTGGAGGWRLFDHARGFGNVLTWEDTSNAADFSAISLTDTGFDIITNNASYNTSGSEYVYLAIR